MTTLRPMFRSCLGTGNTDKETGDSSRGAYELRAGARGVIHSTHEDGEVRRTTSEPSIAGDNDSGRKILASSGIHVTRQYDVESVQRSV
ncbi:hypothetical protein SLS55_002014 [Diplodia seriata]|uniref:Uncharacterized protein n=1 Tax=Diplodia seriata TaxID=420778 RepID=A0ABR3CQY0_9PEZI